MILSIPINQRGGERINLFGGIIAKVCSQLIVLTMQHCRMPLWNRGVLIQLLNGKIYGRGYRA